MPVFVYRACIGDSRPSRQPGLRRVGPGGETEPVNFAPSGRDGWLVGFQRPTEVKTEYDPLAHFDEGPDPLAHYK